MREELNRAAHEIDRATSKLSQSSGNHRGAWRKMTLTSPHGQIGYYTTQVSKGRTRFKGL